MSPGPPPAGTSSSGGHSPAENFRVVRRRNRVPLSCHPCRTRKLKCNRGTPSCENCIKRGDAQSCVYATPANRKKNQNHAAADSQPDDMQNRIDRLEGLVLSLMHGGANIDASAVTTATSTSTHPPTSNSDSPTSDNIERDHEEPMNDQDNDNGEQEEEDGGDSDVDGGLATSLGVLKVDADKGKSMYIGQENWHTLLADITEVKNYYAAHKADFDNTYEKVLSSKSTTALEPPIFLLSVPPASEVELRAELPPKTAVTTLVSRYLNCVDVALSIIHGPTFQRRLQEHWQNPSESPITWLGMLYAVLCLAMLSYHKVGDEPPQWKGRSSELAAEYRLRTVQCLVAANYTKPVEYTVETLLLYAFGESFSRYDADLGLWLISSIITRLAFRMGYHRDAEWFPSITPFQGEVRRRIWAYVRMFDIIYSYQVSLPNMIYDHDTDTKLPHNLFDQEFGPDTKMLPPSRPIAEPTPIAYLIAKMRLCIEFGNIMQAVTRIGRQVSYDDILQHDRRLREMMDEFPPHLKLQSHEEAGDPLLFVNYRLSLDMLFQKIMCMLHRKYLKRARQNPRYAHSRRSAIEAALGTLGHLRTVHRECQPDGRLRTMKWYLVLISRDSLLPTVLVLLELRYDSQAAVSGKRQDSQTLYFWTPEQRQEMFNTLEAVRDIWKSLAQESIDAYKASKVLDIMLDKTKNPTPPPAIPDMGVSVPSNSNPFGSLSSAEFEPIGAAAMTQGMFPEGPTPAFQPPDGTAFPGVDPSFDMKDISDSAGLYPDFQPNNFNLGTNGANDSPSPFSMFTSLGGGGAKALDRNFDWDAFESYTQNANWGPDQSSFGFLAGNAEQQPQAELSPDGSLSFLNMGTPGNRT